MKPIQKDELYGNLSGFLKTKGVELKDGSYTQAIQKSCGMLADVINLSQRGVERAKTELDKGVEHVRQVIHEKTAPPASAASAPPPGPERAPKPSPARKPARRRPAGKR